MPRVAIEAATVYPKKYAHGFCFAVLCCGYTLTDFPISIRLTSLALWQSNDCPSASKATLMNMDKYFMWIHYERLHNHNKAKHNKTVCIFLGIYCKGLLPAWYLAIIWTNDNILLIECMETNFGKIWIKAGSTTKLICTYDHHNYGHFDPECVYIWNDGLVHKIWITYRYMATNAAQVLLPEWRAMC